MAGLNFSCGHCRGAQLTGKGRRTEPWAREGHPAANSSPTITVWGQMRGFGGRRLPAHSPCPKEAMLFFSTSRSHVNRATLPSSSSYFRSLTKCFREKSENAC